MRVIRTRTNVVTLVATSQELSALVAGARMALAVMRADPKAPAEAREMLERAVADYDAGLARADARGPDVSQTAIRGGP